MIKERKVSIRIILIYLVVSRNNFKFKGIDIKVLEIKYQARNIYYGKEPKINKILEKVENN